VSQRAKAAAPVPRAAAMKVRRLRCLFTTPARTRRNDRTTAGKPSCPAMNGWRRESPASARSGLSQRQESGSTPCLQIESRLRKLHDCVLAARCEFVHVVLQACHCCLCAQTRTELRSLSLASVGSRLESLLPARRRRCRGLSLSSCTHSGDKCSGQYETHPFHAFSLPIRPAVASGLIERRHYS
jgi:hypothetical protein